MLNRAKPPHHKFVKAFQFAIWPNSYKQAGSNQPDATGHVAIPIDVLKELSIAYQKGELATERDTRNGDVEVVKLKASAWRNDPEGNRPVISAEISSWSEQKEAAAKRAERDAKGNGASTSDDSTGWSVPF